MKKTLEESNVRKEAWKMTGILIGLVVVIEAVIFVVMSLAMSHMGGLALDKISVCIGVLCFDIVLVIVGYFDFKEEVIKWQKNDKMNEITE